MPTGRAASDDGGGPASAQEVISMLGPVQRRPTGPRLFRFWLLVFVQAWVGATLWSAHVLGVDSIDEASNLEKMANVDLGDIGAVFITGAAILVTAFFIGGRTLRVAHALFAGFYFMLASISIGAMLSGNPLVGTAAAYQLVISWCHYRAGIDQPSLRGGDA